MISRCRFTFIRTVVVGDGVGLNDEADAGRGSDASGSALFSVFFFGERVSRSRRAFGKILSSTGCRAAAAARVYLALALASVQRSLRKDARRRLRLRSAAVRPFGITRNIGILESLWAFAPAFAPTCSSAALIAANLNIAAGLFTPP